jgi:hypothetical protein
MIQDTKIKRETLCGVWELKSCEGKSADGQIFLPYGSKPIGKLIYTDDGHLAVTLMNSDRPHFASEDISKSTTEEITFAFSSFDSYSGRWNLDEQTGRIEHLIEAGRIPNWVGKSHVRYCSVEAGELILATDEFSMGEKTWRVYVKWTRASASHLKSISR